LSTAEMTSKGHYPWHKSTDHTRNTISTEQ